jgi:glutamyl-tRNA reductase
VDRAEQLAADLGAPATAIPLADAAARVHDADVVVTATGSAEPVFDDEALAAAGETVVVDLAVPRDVDPAAETATGVTLRDVETLRGITDQTRERREAAAEAVAAMVDDEFERLLQSYKRERADEAIGAMYEGADRMKKAELARLRSKLEEGEGEVTEAQLEAIEAFADSLVKQLLAPPTRSLKAAAEADDWTTIQTAMGLFDPTVDRPEVDSSPADTETGASAEE